MDMVNDANLQMVHTNNFELYDFTAEANFDQFIDLIRGENEDQISRFDCDLINGLLVDNQIGNPTHQEELFDFSTATTPIYTSAMVPDQNYSLPSFDGDMKELEEDFDEEEDHSSGTTTTTPTATRRKTKTDRSRTLISERKRRGRMKEKLYALRSLVPNITK
ncbi:conserved hypothetical protein [Ricinus communis]|uniref:BHLH domain-containing protein n=3 Tax=Ricinus communis TaxID=3988 RepID=B9SCK3_RICCO|nr:conserved hypothetical protein [Ricinus communis]